MREIKYNIVLSAIIPVMSKLSFFSRWFLPFLLFTFLITGTAIAEDDHPSGETTEQVTSHDGEAEHEEHAGGHETNVDPLFFIIIALIIGTLTRHFLRKSPIPFTVLLLLIGLGLGVMDRFELFGSLSMGSMEFDLSIVHRSLDWAANIDPHLLLFVFLPILIFEAAFAMDVHVFKKSAANASILAIPGIIMAMFLTGIFAMGLRHFGFGLGEWNWEIALMFGAVISATDPVAVVALLKELGASKKLGTLIEGESLLNDGTAIVLFMVFFTGITGEAAASSPIVEFLRVAIGGILVGVVIGYLILNVIKKVVNDAMVEISVGIAAAYLAFFIAEHFLHVSGVLALVSLGIIMGGIGRSRISPQVEHFMHEFWELAGFIANVLIFLIVGVVIAERVDGGVDDFILLGLVYVGIHVVRAVVIILLYPLMRNTGYGLSFKDSYVLWYGALRGAIGLALALIVAGVDDQFIPAEIKNQFLFLTAGIVTLTLLINATTIKFLVNGLGLTKLPPAKVLMVRNAYDYLINASDNHIERLKSDRYLKKADFSVLKKYQPEPPVSAMTGDTQIETIAELRKRILEKEKSSYWHQFKDGLLGPEAVRALSEGINEVLDAGGMTSLADRKDFEDNWEMPRMMQKMQKIPLLGAWTKRIFLERLTVSYDCAVGFVEAQEEATKLVESIYRAGNEEETKNLPEIENEINENKIHGQTFIRNLRKNYPEVYEAISTRQAVRAMLSYERKTIERLQKNGRIDGGEAARMKASLEKRGKRLQDHPPMMKKVKTQDKKAPVRKEPMP